MSNILSGLIALFLICIYILKLLRQKKEKEKMFSRDAISRLNRSDKKLRKAIKYSLTSLAIVLLVKAFFISLSSQDIKNIFDEKNEHKKRIVFVLDVSLSMISDDVTPSRLERAKLYLEEILNTTPGYSYALVPFAGGSFIQCPFTEDTDILKQYLGILNKGTITAGGSCFSCAITVALDLLDRTGGDNKHQNAIVVLTDGADFCDDDEGLYKKIKTMDIKTYIIGLGGNKPVPIVLIDDKHIGSRVLKLDHQGNPVLTKLDTQNLKKIADLMGAKYSFNTIEAIDDIKQHQKGLHSPSHDLESKLEKQLFFYVVIPMFLLFINQLITVRSRKHIKWAGRFEI